MRINIMQMVWKKDWTRIIFLFLILRLVYSVLGVIVSSNPDLQSNPSVDPFPAADSLLYHDYFSDHFVNVWERWDTGWYLKIAKFGYDATDGTSAFSPLFPYLTRILALLTGNYLVSALLISNLFALIVFILFYEIASTQKMDDKQSFNAVLSIALFPSAFFLFAAYTESLFLALVLGTWLAAHYRRWLIAGLLAVLATLTRYQGVLLTPVLLWFFVVAQVQVSSLKPYSQIRQVFNLATTRQGWLIIFQAFRNLGWLSLLLPFLTYILFSYYLKSSFGSVSEAIKTHWGISTVAPWSGFIQFLQRLFSTPRIAMDYIDIALLLVVLALLVANLYRLNPASILYSCLMLASLFMRGTVPHLLESFNRYLLVIFPTFLALSYIKSFKTRLIIWITFYVLQIFLLYAFLNWVWVA